MDEIARAEQHGWEWHPAGDFEPDAHDRVVDLEGAGEGQIQKVTRGGIAVAFIRRDAAGDQLLLPSVPSDNSEEDE